MVNQRAPACRPFYGTITSDFGKCQIPKKIKSWNYRKADRENKPNGI